jgi:hypothetical protein
MNKTLMLSPTKIENGAVNVPLEKYQYMLGAVIGISRLKEGLDPGAALSRTLGNLSMQKGLENKDYVAHVLPKLSAVVEYFEIEEILNNMVTE